MKVIVQNFIENTNCQLAKRGWNRSEFARRLGVTPGFVTQILNGHREPGLRVVEHWANTLGVPPTSLLRKKNSENAA